MGSATGPTRPETHRAQTLVVRSQAPPHPPAPGPAPPAPPLTSRPAPRSTRRRSARAARCSPTAAPRRSSCWASSRCLRCWCSPPPPAPAWPGASARCCRPPRGPLDPAYPQGRATAGGQNATPTGRSSSSAPGCDPRGPSKPREAPHPPVAPIKWPQVGELELDVCVQVPQSRVHASGSFAVLRVTARWHWTPSELWGDLPPLPTPSPTAQALLLQRRWKASPRRHGSQRARVRAPGKAAFRASATVAALGSCCLTKDSPCGPLPGQPGASSKVPRLPHWLESTLPEAQRWLAAPGPARLGLRPRPGAVGSLWIILRSVSSVFCSML